MQNHVIMRMLVVAVAGLLVTSAPLTGHATAAKMELKRQLNFPNKFGAIGEPPAKDVLKVQRKAERAYEQGRYDSAFWYYRTDLAPIGDKYAQYMVGYMKENGIGTPVDEAGAAAWYALAAERGHEQIVETSLNYQKGLSRNDLVTASVRVERLKREYGDRSLLERLIRNDIHRLNMMTGTRTKFCGVNARIVLPRSARGSMPQYKYCRMLKDRVEMRMQYLGGYVEFGELELLPNEQDGTGIAE
ncbi:MAG: hypothetical protein AAF290_07150 [Pseudomonadota bacterium]